MKQFKIPINKKWFVFILYLVVIGCFSILYYNEWKKDDKCFVINDKLNPPPAKIIRENFYASILSNTDELPYEEKRLEELLNKYLVCNKEIEEKFSKSNSLVANETDKYIRGHVEVEGGLSIINPVIYHNLDLTFSSKLFKTIFLPDSAIESRESDKMLSKIHIYRNIMNQDKRFEDFKNCFSNAKNFKQAVDFTISNSTMNHEMFKELQPFIDLVIEEINKNEVVLDEAEDSLDDYWERIPDKNTPFITFIDFLYFSLISATTTGYGDIIPNSTDIRILVSIEILLCLFLFGYFLSFLGKKKNWIWVFPPKKTGKPNNIQHDFN
ncbi:MAG: two pore domain potassium channel family protein [Planctomycetes bacterium]|nr:two pore domain potassium channel family protein [Planctomycetota bacterium]